MKATEKELIYDFLKAADAAATGYTSPEFSGTRPSFLDDPEPDEGAAFSQSAVPLRNAESAQNTGALQSETDLQESAGFDGEASMADSGGASCASIAAKVAACTRCKLCQGRKNVVPGEGVESPAVLVIGEGPGADEDDQGRPFVGRAGQLLDKMLASIGLDRKKNCFITNIVKCRPPMNRDPLPDEAAACRSFLDAQVHVLKPKMILAMGRVALHNLLDTSIGITRMHGQIVDFNGIPFMATFHPSALLRDESYKRPAWEDLKKFRARLLEIVPDYV